LNISGVKQTTNGAWSFKLEKSILLLEKAEKIKWIESIVISILSLIIGYSIDPLDPFFINYQFPWLILAPLLTSLRYGLVYGITTSLLLISIVSIGFYLEWPQVPFFPKEMIIGLMLLTMISAEFYELWNRKIKLLEYKYDHINLRMNKFARTYHLIKGSHYQLEQHLASQAKSLRLALSDLEKQILSLEKNRGEPLAGIGESILKIFGSYANVQIAAIYAVNEQRKIITEPVARLGQSCTLLSSDPLIGEALRTGHVASIKVENDDAIAADGAIVAIPLLDVYQKIWGIVVVNEMPLFALQESTMDLFTVLGGKIGDLIKQRAESSSNNNNDRKIFERKLRRILEEINYLDESAVAIAIIISPEELQSKFLIKFQTELRGVDEMRIFKNSRGHLVFLLLLPYTDGNGANEFLNRIELSKLSAEKVCHESDRKVFSYCDGDVRACMWILNNKTSSAKILLETYQFCKNGFIDSEMTGNLNESISDSI